MTEHVWELWKDAMKAARGGFDWWNFRDIELAIGPLFLDALEQMSVFTEEADMADFVFVTWFGGMISAKIQHPWYETPSGKTWKNSLTQYQREFDAFLRSSKYVRQRGFGFVFEAGHVYTPSEHAWSSNNLFIATDPAFARPDKILVPYASVWPDQWTREEINGCEKKYWLSFKGGLSGGSFHQQRHRLQKEIFELQDKRIFWNDARISGNASERWTWMCQSKFCLDPEGDVVSTLREFEPVVVGCVPVMLTAYDYPFHKFLGPYTQWAVILPPEFSVKQIVAYLEKMPEDVYSAKRKKGLEIAAHFLYSSREVKATGKAAESIVSEICQKVPKLKEDLSRVLSQLPGSHKK